MYIKDLSNEALVAHYIALKALAYNAAAIRSPKLGKLVRDLDFTIAIARKRMIRLPV